MTCTRSAVEDGASAVEYSFIVAAIAAIVVLVVFAVGAFTGELFADTCGSLDAASALTSAANC